MHCMACGISVLPPGIELGPWAVRAESQPLDCQGLPETCCFQLPYILSSFADSAPVLFWGTTSPTSLTPVVCESHPMPWLFEWACNLDLDNSNMPSYHSDLREGQGGQSQVFACVISKEGTLCAGTAPPGRSQPESKWPPSPHRGSPGPSWDGNLGASDTVCL